MLYLLAMSAAGLMMLQSTGLHRLVNVPRPALLAAASRCAQPLANFDAPDNTPVNPDECVISEAGSTCMPVDVSDGIDAPNWQGQQRNFYQSYTDYMPPVEFGAESAIPGREKEYEAFKAQSGNGPAPMQSYPAQSYPVDGERRKRSPGLARDFSAMSNEDFRRPYGTSGPSDNMVVPPLRVPPATREGSATRDGSPARSAPSAAQAPPPVTAPADRAQQPMPKADVKVKSVKERMVQLTELLEAGLVTQSEYEAKRAAIIDSL